VKGQNKKKGKGKGKSGAIEAGGEPKLSLTLFRPVEWPDVLPVKLRYDDFRAVTASVNQAVYVYRINSVFDPDFMGVGGQPGGFDQLKALYGRYRVMAFKYKFELEVITASDAASLVCAPVDSSSFSTTAEAVADLRHASKVSSAQFGSAKAVVQGMWHVGELLGYSDLSVLANTNMDAAVTANPSFQQFCFVCWETSGASTAAWLTATLEYFVRMEVPIAVQDAQSHKSKFAKLRSPPTPASSLIPATAGLLPKAVSVESGSAVAAVQPPLSTQQLAVSATPQLEKPSQVSVDLRARLMAELDRINSLLALDQQVA